MKGAHCEQNRLPWRPLPGYEPWPQEDRELFIECFRLILERCDPNLRAQQYGPTILHEVISRDDEDRAALARMLLEPEPMFVTICSRALRLAGRAAGAPRIGETAP